mmetsp:Transcript_8321/g.20973  ORF Transcript_8321/g.20973 Transcript_8321/m.20973 type:complete len:197 (+) Transcript_8321:108-698(+)
MLRQRTALLSTLLLTSTISVQCSSVCSLRPLSLFPSSFSLSISSSPSNMARCGLPQSDEELRKLLTPEQYRITKQNGTERPFKNAYWDNKKPGVYVCVISGDPLFSSKEKFDSGSGWPSFYAPLRPEAIVEKRDISHGMVRVEVRAAVSNSHLGHVFEDGPPPTGLRYCINSGSLRFVEKSKLEKEGLGEWSTHLD